MMHQVYNLWLERGTFAQFQFQIELAKLFKDDAKALQMLLLHVAIHYHVI